ncbi:uncharacterized protein si:ch211-214j8.12 [Hippoglossus stenolepis]|uniref:uncharacterized protein si:ch211-214j8.12 n=1 Tax=Hippoglossus stenolepis TaxID=195615 RepID=UPI001FB03D41|nr:uncharacterized protein si:ch211-214j8.12 [Hippoglossus stenolepis]XP_047197030.1 uncharacterized protein si:ch211-214j8.12 [Hippoglossus stenolepis]
MFALNLTKPLPRRCVRNIRCKGRGGRTDEDGSVLSLTRLCLLSLADNMKDVWVKDYADKYLDQYSFRHIMGPFNLLPGELVEELTQLLCTRKQLSRAALHLLLVPQLRGLSLESCPGLVTSALCAHITARCQGLCRLDLSGAQQLPSKVLCETLCCLPALRSLSLAGMPCDRCVISTIAHHCRLLRHLDVSCCHFLSPAALLPLGGGAFCSSSARPSSSSFCRTSTSPPPSSSFSSAPSPSVSSSLPPLPLTSLLALDIGFGEEDGDNAVAAAYLLLSLPGLERVAMEGLAQACCLIEHREFKQTDAFSYREGVPRLEEVWRERRNRQGIDSWRKKREGAAAGVEEHDEEEEILWEEYCGKSEKDACTDEEPSCSLKQAEEKKRGRVLSESGDEHLILHLKDVKGVTWDRLESLSRLCPDICSISVNADDESSTSRRNGSVLAAALQTWSGQLLSLSVQFPGPLVDLLPAIQVVGSSLVSLTVEGVKTSPQTSLLEVIKSCPRLRDLLIFAEPPIMPEEENGEEDRWDDRDLPRVPHLCSLTLKFSYSHSQMKPAMSWMSLRKTLMCLLIGSPLLEKLTLVSLPCPLDCVLQRVLGPHLNPRMDSTDAPPVPLRRVQHITLQRTDVTMVTVKNIIQHSKRLKLVDVRYCWRINKVEWLSCMKSSEVQVVWV